MGLKFRRGSTAQQSGSLAFGEPYVNTTLGTLVVGGATGDIILSSTGTGSTGNFGAISGSGLDITGNANIAGNLTLGGAITIGDNTTDTVNVVASLSSSLIPSITNAFDLGSENYFWRDLYISTGSIKFVGAAGTVVGTLTNTGNGLNLDGGVVTAGNSSFGTSSLSLTAVTGSLRVNGNVVVTNGGITGSIAATNGVVSGSSQIASQISASLSAEHLNSKVAGIVSGSSQVITILDSLNTFSGSQLTQNTALATISGSLISSASTAKTTNDTQDVSITNLNTFSGSALTRLTALEVETANLESFTSSINTTIKTKLNVDGVISGSSQVTISDTTGYTTFSSSLDSRITTEKGRVDAILLAADADKNSFAEIVTLINSVDLSNDTSFASFYTASVGRLNNLESTSASVNTSVSNINTFSGSALTRLSALEVETANLESFSSSALTRLSTLEGKDISITLTGDVTGTGTITDLSNVSFATTIAANSVALGTDTTGDYVASMTAGTGITVGTATGEGSTPVITNTGVTSNVAGNAITVSGATGAVTINHADTSTAANLSATSRTYVTALTFDTYGHVTAYSTGTETVTDTNTVTTNIAGTGVTVSSGTGNSTISIGQAVATSDNVRFNSLGIGMAASATAGRIDATNDIVAFSSSDIRFKENITPIENALEKISKISGNTYDWKAENKAEHGYEGNDVGVIAQEIEAVLPQLVQTRENGFKAVKYDKLVALLIEGIKEQQTQIHSLTIEIEKLKESKGL
jgi:hypothetical protein